MKLISTILAGCVLLAGCGGSGTSKKPGTQPPPVSTCDDSIEFCDSIPGDADPCTDLQYWPLNVSSAAHPVSVHFTRLSDETKALEMIDLLDESWAVQVDTLGFTAPIDDGGQCGPDGNFDVFIWRGIDGAYVSGVAEVASSPHDDYTTHMVIDISGSIGNQFLDTYIAHEFNHALQAGDDWWEDSPHYEAGATFAESLVYPSQRDYFFTLEDFQDNPGWSLFYNDNFATWYMYGAAMYLHFLHERYFSGDPEFYARIWFATRSLPRRMRPDFLDALRIVLLTERGVALDDSILEFSQWRWFVDSLDDGAHFSNGAIWEYPVAVTEIDVADLPADQAVSAMIYGANYLRLTNNGATPVEVTAILNQNDPALEWRLLNVIGGGVAAPLTIPASDSVVIVAVLLPAEELWTDTLSFDEHVVDISLATVP